MLNNKIHLYSERKQNNKIHLYFERKQHKIHITLKILCNNRLRRAWDIFLAEQYHSLGPCLTIYTTAWVTEGMHWVDNHSPSPCLTQWTHPSPCLTQTNVHHTEHTQAANTLSPALLRPYIIMDRKSLDQIMYLTKSRLGRLWDTPGR